MRKRRWDYDELGDTSENVRSQWGFSSAGSAFETVTAAKSFPCRIGIDMRRNTV
jgi:hypothetical protein